MSEQTFMLKVAGLATATEALLKEKEAFNKSAASTVGKLAELGSVKAEDKVKLAASIQENPGKLLNILEKLAESNQKQGNELKKQAAEKCKAKKKVTNSMGTPDATSSKQASESRLESDMVWENTFRNV